MVRAMSIDVRETEWQFDVPDLHAVLRWLSESDERTDAGAMRVVAGGTVNQVDVYLDTDDRRFQRAGYALRIRRVGRRRGGEATLKGVDSASPGTPGLRTRRELTERLEKSDPLSVVRAGGPVGDRVRAVVGQKQLLPLFEVRARRRTFSFEADGLPAAELALDETTILPSDVEARA
jgi:inorganic triphosphatase YgiF